MMRKINIQVMITTCGFGGLVGWLVGSEVGRGVGGVGLSPPMVSYYHCILPSFHTIPINFCIDKLSQYFPLKVATSPLSSMSHMNTIETFMF